MIWRNLPSSQDGIPLSHRMCGAGAPILMVHGIGPGTSGPTNFAPLFDRLAPRFALHLIDLAGFGASARLRQPPFFNVAFWLRQIGAAIDRILPLHRIPPLLIGNSVGGALALKTAARRSDLRHVLAIGAPARPRPTDALRGFWTAPRTPAGLAAAMRPMTAGQAEPPPAILAERFAAFKGADSAAYFNAMLADPQACLSDAVLTAAEAARITARVTLMHGRLDRACPADDVLTVLMPLLPEADLALLGDCGHSVIAERTADAVATIERLREAPS